MRETTICVEGMDCSAEETVIRRRLSVMPGVEGLEFDLIGRRVKVRHRNGSAQPIVAAIRELGMNAAEERGAGASVQTEVPAKQQGTLRHHAPLAVAGLAALAAEIVSMARASETGLPSVGLALVALVLSAPRTLKKAFAAVRALSITINVLMVVAVLGAIAIGEWPEAAMVSFLFAVAEAIEASSLDRARHAIGELLEIAPEVALVRTPDGTFAEQRAALVLKEDVVRVRPGERIPLDGVVIAGASAVDQSPITGESIPVEKAAGAQVFAGTINTSGTLDFRVTGERGATTIDRIAKAVSEARQARAPAERFVDRFARVYTPAVIALALGVALVPPLIFASAWQPWIYRALVLLVIACPCALVISTPVSIVSALAAAARRGVLVKGGAYLEVAARIRVLALDKTGTITEGRLRVTEITRLNETSEQDVLTVAGALSSRSEHPVSRAVAAHSQAAGVATAEVEGFRSIPGKGVEGTVRGRKVTLGSHRYAHERGLCDPGVENALAALEEKGETSIVVANETHAMAVIGVADAIKATSPDVIRDLSSLGVRTVMLSGDATATARAVALRVGMQQAQGALLPEDKRSTVRQLRADHGVVGMVGDGVNDAPALAEASIGIAMGAAGSGTAIETADVALMDDDLRKIPALIRHSRMTHRILVQNIAFALATKAVFFALALAGMATLWMAVFADMGASLIVVANGLRLLSKRQGSVFPS